jgi:hypothetical protein
MLANQAAYSAWRRVFNDPSQAYGQQNFQEYHCVYDLLQEYHDNSIFEKFNRVVTEAYRRDRNLYRYIRPVRNPIKRLGKFYAGKIYPGALVEDESELDEGMESAMPFTRKVDDRVKSAVAQIWEWSNWQSNKSVYVRTGAALGDVFLEVVDDLEKGKVYIDVLRPNIICDLDLDKTGNVKAYAYEYQSYDDDGSFLFRKEADGGSFRLYRNDQLYQEIENIYGFVPGAWVNHFSTNTIHGDPAMSGDGLIKLDELNNLISQTHDQIKKVLQSPTVLATSNPGGIKRFLDQAKRGPTSEFDQAKASDPESILLFTAGADTKAQPLLSMLDLAGTQKLIEAQDMEIQKDHPELGFFDDLRKMTQLTGPAADRIVGDVKAPVYEAMSNYDRGAIAALQMCLAICGMRVNDGAYGALTAEQEKFRPFNLDSFKRGDLYLKFKPRPILTPTRLEIAQRDLAFWQGVQAADSAGVPLKVVLRKAGWTEQELAELEAEDIARQEQIQRQQMLAQQDFIPTTQQ